MYLGAVLPVDHILTKEIGERIQTAIDLEDPDFVLDLRTENNGRPGDKFTLFWQELERQINIMTLPAADERRHGDGIAHMAYYISLR